MAGTFAHHAHGSVDILQHYMSPAQRRACEMLVCGSAMLLFAAITYAGAGRAWESYAAGDVLAGLIPWPTWPSIAPVPLGCGLMADRKGVGSGQGGAHRINIGGRRVLKTKT